MHTFIIKLAVHNIALQTMHAGFQFLDNEGKKNWVKSQSDEFFMDLFLLIL